MPNLCQLIYHSVARAGLQFTVTRHIASYARSAIVFGRLSDKMALLEPRFFTSVLELVLGAYK